MGLFDRLLNKGAKALGDMVSDKISDVVNGDSDKSFDEKLQTILQNAGNYKIKEYISPDTLEQEFGQEIYTRGGGRCEPEDITYGIYQGGNRVLFIRFWDSYNEYAHVANREIKNFCDANNVKMLDFFEYLPNEEDYMEQRIREQLV